MRPQHRQVKRDILLLCLAAFFLNLHFFAAVSIPFFQDWLELTYSEIFLIQSWFMLTIFVFELPGGLLADRVGRKYTILTGLVFSCSGFIAFGSLKGLAGMLIAETLCGVGAAFVNGADRALIYDLLAASGLESMAQKTFAKYRSFAIAGIIVGLPLGSFVASSSLLPYPNVLPLTFLWSSIALSLAIPLVLLVKEPLPRQRDMEKSTSGFSSLKLIFTNKTLLRLTLNSVFINATTFSLMWFYQPVLKSVGVELRYYGIIAAGFNLTGVILLRFLRFFEQRIGMQRVLTLASTIPGMIFLALSLTHIAPLVISLLFVFMGLRTLRFPLLQDYINQNIQSHNRATVLSGISMAQRFGLVILNPLIGLLADFSLSAALFGLGIVTLSFSTVFKIRSKHLVHPASGD